MLQEAFAWFVMLGILSLLIIVHECGHFLVARFFGFQTPVFGFGLPFGPHVVVGHKWGTEFRIYACLLGGFVAIPELGDESQLASQDAFGVALQPFRKFPIWQRALVAFAGVGFNILFAYIIMVSLFLTLGQPNTPTVVHSLIQENPIASTAGMKVGDEVASIDDCDISSPDDAVTYLTRHKATLVHVHVVRDKQPLTIDMTTNENGKVGMALVPKSPVTYKKVEGNFLEISWKAVTKLTSITTQMMDALWDMVQGLITKASGGKPAAGHQAVGIQDLHGVLAVIKIGADIAKQDWSQLFLFTIMISMDLAIVNLLPIPALDGGHLAFMAFEAVRGKPMNERVQGEIVKWGFISLILLMAVIMVNDLSALFTGKLDFKMKGSSNSNSTAGPNANSPNTNTSTTTSGDTTGQSAQPNASSNSPSTTDTQP